MKRKSVLTDNLEQRMTTPANPPRYPEGLLEWAGHRSGGVRRLFYDATGGRPSGDLIQTPLLARLSGWAEAVAGGQKDIPRIVLLVGGPGNGKTEAVEDVIRQLEVHFAIDSELQDQLRPLFAPTDGSTVPRRAELSWGAGPIHSLALVQDASVTDHSKPAQTAASLLVDDLVEALSGGAGSLYLACVNRGVLDDALILVTDAKREGARHLLESIVRAVGTHAAAPPCWPLNGYPAVAVWPMDAESLLVSASQMDNAATPAAQMLALATSDDRWSPFGECAAGVRCPYCQSRLLLSQEPHQASIQHILRWYELATGKRWSFRDLFSLISYMLAGSASGGTGKPASPCELAAQLLEVQSAQSPRLRTLRAVAPFRLVASQYQHVLFSSWHRFGRGALRSDLRDLQLLEHDTLYGLSVFLSGPSIESIPATVRPQLTELCVALDPALADPELEVEVSGKSSIRLRDLDSRFSHSVREGLQFIRKYHVLTPLESDLLGRLADADDEVGTAEVRRRKPTAAARIQMLLRDFSCRLVRRTVGCRVAVVRELTILRDFDAVVSGNEELTHQAVRRVSDLLNEDDRFIVTLNTTFGEPLPPESRRVVLTTAKQKVRPSGITTRGRPTSDTRFLTVGTGTTTQLIPLTFELFRSVRELQDGMLASSLPRTVIALLDTTRARLAGRIVRDEEQLDGAEIRVGTKSEVIVRELGKFLVRSETE